jgi:hypothetical protein
MASRVFFHIGVPKSGTTYLQGVLWSHQEWLRDEDVQLPGGGYVDHRWGSLVVREDDRLRHRRASARGAWERILTDVAAWDKTSVISHEFYGGASQEQARRAIDGLAPAEVHLVVTARNPLHVLCSAWQEMVKYGNTTSLEDFSVTSSPSPGEVWNWRSLDVGEVLGRWGGLVPPDRVHVVPVAAERSDPEELWWRFAELFVKDAQRFDTEAGEPNASIGLVECEVLRRVGPHLKDLTALPRSNWVRKYLAETLLAQGSGERFWPSADRIEECRERGRAAVDLVRRQGFDVRGDLFELEVPAELEARRSPDEVSDAEIADVSAELIARLLRDVRRGHRRAQQAPQPTSPEAEPPEPPAPAAGGGWRARVSRALRRT